MNYTYKKAIIFLLTVAIIFTFSVPTFATSNQNLPTLEDLNKYLSDDSSVNFLKISDNKVVYTYERDGKIYKNIDNITSQNTVTTEVYLLTNIFFTHVDTITSVIEGSTITETSAINGESFYDISRVTTSTSYNWKYTSSYDGNTSLRNQSATAIAILLGGLIGGGWGAFVAVGAYIFDKNIDIVYYHVKQYKDLNSNIHRPIFKHESYFYEDAAHKKPLPDNPVISIVKS